MVSSNDPKVAVELSIGTSTAPADMQYVDTITNDGIINCPFYNAVVITLTVVDAPNGSQLVFEEIMIYEKLDVASAHSSFVTLNTGYPTSDPDLTLLTGLTAPNDNLPIQFTYTPGSRPYMTFQFNQRT